MRRTKILITLGPTTDNIKILREMVRFGIDAVRCNFSYENYQVHKKRIFQIRKISKEENKNIGILIDLQGPKIRITEFKKKIIYLKKNNIFILDPDLKYLLGDENRVGINYKNLYKDLNLNDILLIDEGKLILLVTKIQKKKIFCQVKRGGYLSNNKGINKFGGGLSAPALTEKDKKDIKFAAMLKADFLAVSFPKNENDIKEVRKLLLQEDSKANIIAKIERSESIKNITNIIKESEGIMIARGDLSLEIGDEYVPGIQKKIISQTRSLDKIVITATQMMESMICNPIPTRAEVSDVANAVFDGTDAVMLSGESAIGKYPIKVIKKITKICLAAEKNPIIRNSQHRMNSYFNRIDESIAMATMYTANHLNVKAIVALTESGDTTLWMSRIHSHIPIFALTRNVETQRKVTLYRGVKPLHFDPTKIPKNNVNSLAIKELLKKGLVKIGELIILTYGDHMGRHGGTNKMKIIRVNSII